MHSNEYTSYGDHSCTNSEPFPNRILDGTDSGKSRRGSEPGDLGFSHLIVVLRGYIAREKSKDSFSIARHALSKKNIKQMISIVEKLKTIFRM